MPSPEDIFSSIELDRATREREIRLIENSARRASADEERDMLLRVAVLITYAHLEGFSRFSLGTYVCAINSMNLKCEEASVALVAATFTKIFAGLRDPRSKHSVFANTAPDDTKLHLAAREQEFLERLFELLQNRVQIPDRAVDTKSNLSSIVLKKNLFRLGLPFPVVDQRKSDIDRLLGERNSIAHGDSLKVPRQEDVDKYVASAFEVMKFIQLCVFESLRDKRYLRASA